MRRSARRNHRGSCLKYTNFQSCAHTSKSFVQSCAITCRATTMDLPTAVPQHQTNQQAPYRAVSLHVTLFLLWFFARISAWQYRKTICGGSCELWKLCPISGPKLRPSVSFPRPPVPCSLHCCRLEAPARLYFLPSATSLPCSPQLPPKGSL